MKNCVLFLLLLAMTSCAQEMKQKPPQDRSRNRDLTVARQLNLEGKNDSALVYLNQALAKADTTDHSEITDIYFLRCRVFTELGSFEKAMEDALKALSISEQFALFDKKATALLTIGNIHFMMYHDDEAEKYYLQGQAIAEEHQFETEMMKSYGALGNLYKSAWDRHIDRLDEAFSCYNKALDIAQKQHDTISNILYLMHLGDYYTNLNRYVDPNKIEQKYQRAAKQYFDKALSLALLKNSIQQVNMIKLALIGWCNSNKNYAKALEYAHEILRDNDTDAPNNFSYLLQVYDKMVAIYAYLGDSKNAIDAHQEFYLLMIKQSDYQLQQAMQEMSVKYQTAEKELEIVRQQSEIKRKDTILYISVAGLAIVVLLALLLGYIVRIRTLRNRELSESNAVKDKFFSIISHDLKNPAISQRDALQTLLDNSDQWDSGTLRMYYQELLSSADHQVDLLYNLLNWAYLQTERMPFAPRPFDLTPRLCTDLALLQYMADLKNIRLHVHLPEHALVTGDSDMLSTVVRNLVTNAIKFTHNGGDVTLDVSVLDTSPQGAPATCTVTVTDTGIGMTGEQLQNLFRIDRAQTRTGAATKQRTGLGMVICCEFLEKHGSRLDVESEVGKGSRFWFTL